MSEKRLKPRYVRREGAYQARTAQQRLWGLHLRLSTFASSGWALTSFSTAECKVTPVALALLVDSRGSPYVFRRGDFLSGITTPGKDRRLHHRRDLRSPGFTDDQTLHATDERKKMAMEWLATYAPVAVKKEKRDAG